MPASAQPYAPTLSASGSSPGSPYDYAAAIDPTLDGGDASQMQIPAASFDSSSEFKPNLDKTGPYSLNASDQQNNKGESS